MYVSCQTSARHLATLEQQQLNVPVLLFCLPSLLFFIESCFEACGQNVKPFTERANPQIECLMMQNKPHQFTKPSELSNDDKVAGICNVLLFFLAFFYSQNILRKKYGKGEEIQNLQPLERMKRQASSNLCSSFGKISSLMTYLKEIGDVEI